LKYAKELCIKQGKVAADGLTSEILADKELMNTCGLRFPGASRLSGVRRKKKYV